MTTYFRTPLGLVALFLALASCSPSPEAGGGIGGTGSVATVSSGPVTKFGSVFVSGTEYDNSNTIYCIDEDPCSSENKLKLGMVVLVNGRLTEVYSTNQPSGRIADKITFEETVEGMVQSVAADGLSLIVLGQVVHVDQKTIIDSSVSGQSIGNLKPGIDRVEISGFVVSDGHILATLIAMQTGDPHYEVQGAIKNHDAKAKTFQIGALEIDYSSADISAMPSPTSSSWNKIVVQVRGDQLSPGGSGSYGVKLAATRVKSLGLGVEDSEEAEVEGFIIQTSAPGDFFVNNLHVQTTASTVFEGGTVNDLLIGAHIEIHGQLVSGVLQAEQVSFKGDIELEANVASISTGSKTLSLAGLSGMTIQVDSNTSIEGQGNIRRFEEITVGDHLKIEGRAGGSSLLAKEIERSGPTTGIKLAGPIRSASDPFLVIAGATIDTSSIPGSGFTGSSGTVIGRSAFFQGLKVGHKVSLKGTWTGSAVNWTSASVKE